MVTTAIWAWAFSSTCRQMSVSCAVVVWIKDVGEVVDVTRGLELRDRFCPRPGCLATTPGTQPDAIFVSKFTRKLYKTHMKRRSRFTIAATLSLDSLLGTLAHKLISP